MPKKQPSKIKSLSSKEGETFIAEMNGDVALAQRPKYIQGSINPNVPNSYLLENLLHPSNLKEIKDVLINVPDDVLASYQVFNFVWGDQSGTSSWKRKETPKQYWKRRKALDDNQPVP